MPFTPHPNSPANSPVSPANAQTPSIRLAVPQEDHKSAKTNLVGETHWRFTCNEHLTLRQMIEKSPAFTDSRNAFRDVKRQLRLINALPPPLFLPSLKMDSLIRLLPEHRFCKHWISQYFETYGKLFDFIDPNAIWRLTENIWNGTSTVQASSIILVLLIIAVAMQNDDGNRLLGRRVAQQLQDFFYSSGVLGQADLGVLQSLCLLVLLRYISTSDTDKFDGMSSVLGKTHQMALAMKLHRDPSSFPTIGPFEAELRKRLWSNFFRLAVEYSVQSGSPLITRPEDTDCPLPLNIGWSDSNDEVTLPPAPRELFTMTESTFGIIMCKLATLAASTHQAISSSNPKVSPESCRELRNHLQQVIGTLPRCLQSGIPSTNSLVTLQQNLIVLLAQRSLLLLSTHLLRLKTTPEVIQKTLLFEIWDSSCSILRSVRSMSTHSNMWRLGYQLGWADACRATFCAAMALRKLCKQQALSNISPNYPLTVVPLQKTLNESLSYTSDLWLQQVQFGPTAAKAYLDMKVLADISAVAPGLGYQHITFEYDLLAAGVRSANQAVENMRRIAKHYASTQLQQAQPPRSVPLPILTPPRSDHSQAASASLPSSPANSTPMTYAKSEIPSLPTARSLDGVDLDLHNFHFDPLRTLANSSQTQQQGLYGVAGKMATFPTFPQHLPYEVPTTVSNTSAGDMQGQNAGTLQQPDALIYPSILPWVDHDGMANTSPLNFHSTWWN